MMALTPQHLAESLEFDEVAYLLEGLDPARVEERLYPPEDLVRIPKWQRVMVDAIQDGSLKVDKEVCVIINKSVTSAAEQSRIWPEDPSSLYFYDPRQHDLVAQFRRQDVYLWLKSRGTKDDDIPQALQSTPTLEDEPEQGSEVDDVKALQVLGLLAEALAQRHRGLYGIAADKPNRSRILDIMLEVVEGYERPADTAVAPINLHGFRKTTLDEILKKSIREWKAKKNSF